jgi:peptide/nickel transport system ATP-binding protein
VGDVTVLEVRDLVVDYGAGKESARAVDGVSFDLSAGEFLAIVGESGCGKSTLLFAITQLLNPPAETTGGSIVFKGTDMVQLSEKKLRHVRWRDYSVVMQSAMNALNPVKTIAAQFKDALDAHAKMSKGEIRARSAEVLRMVGIDPVHLKSFPHQLSGGMRQRAMIAMALLFTPELIVMDEPTSALDVVAQRSLMTQIKQLQEQLGFAIIFVTHDMSLVSHYSDRLAVMYAGQFSEIRDTVALFEKPLHPYSRGLLEAFPSVWGPRVYLDGIPGSPPDLTALPPGCRFAPRCPEVMDRCRVVDPSLYEVDDARVRCLLYEPELGAAPDGTHP